MGDAAGESGAIEVADGVGVLVGVADGFTATVALPEARGVGATEEVLVGDGVRVGDGVAVDVAVGLAVGLGVEVGFAVGVGEAVGVTTGCAGAAGVTRVGNPFAP